MQRVSAAENTDKLIFFDIRVKIIGAEGGTNGAGLGCGYGGALEVFLCQEAKER